MLSKKLLYVIIGAIVLFKFKNENFERTFTDVLWLSLVFIGLILALTFDDKDAKIQQKLTLRYVIFSIASSIGVCFLVAIGKATGELESDFYFYSLTIAGSTFSPFLARLLIKKLPGTAANATNKVVKTTIEEIGSVAKNKLITALGGAPKIYPNTNNDDINNEKNEDINDNPVNTNDNDSI